MLIGPIARLHDDGLTIGGHTTVNERKTKGVFVVAIIFALDAEPFPTMKVAGCGKGSSRHNVAIITIVSFAKLGICLVPLLADYRTDPFYFTTNLGVNAREVGIRTAGSGGHNSHLKMLFAVLDDQGATRVTLTGILATTFDAWKLRKEQ